MISENVGKIQQVYTLKMKLHENSVERPRLFDPRPLRYQAVEAKGFPCIFDETVSFIGM